MAPPHLPRQRWRFLTKTPISEQATFAWQSDLSPLLQQVLRNRGIVTPEKATVFCHPEQQALPSPLTVFPDLPKSVEILAQAIAVQTKIAICGDYDADGMTSTALLLRAIRHLGGRVDYAIPSRMTDGYGINERIVREFAEEGVGLILTVDNGISAYGAIALAKELGLTVIITDHHDLPEILPPADAILNPKLIPSDSPYAGLAGVGVAYVLAIATAQHCQKITGLTEPLLELFTLGTIADLAPLVGVNRRWLRRGLKRLPMSQLAGIQALMQVAGIDDQQKSLKPDDIGFKLGPRINAVGRIGDPQVVIELLTTDDLLHALAQAVLCEQTNKQRQELCTQIEQAAIALVEDTPLDWRNDWVLTPMQPGWHHGVIGIVASRLVERYGVPVFIASLEEDGETIRGSARGIEEFNVFDALMACEDLLDKFGGHRAAGGFSLNQKHWLAFHDRLSQFAHACLDPHYLKPLVKIDAQANLAELNLGLVEAIESLHPWGIGNEFPVFWTPQVTIADQQLIGKDKTHLRLTLTDRQGRNPVKAIAWRWGDFYPLPSPLDLAYKVQKNHFNGQTTVQLELVGARLPQVDESDQTLVKPSQTIKLQPQPLQGNWQGGWALGEKASTLPNAPWLALVQGVFQAQNAQKLPQLVQIIVEFLRQSPALPRIQRLMALPSPSPLWSDCITAIAQQLHLPLEINGFSVNASNELTLNLQIPDLTNQYCLLLATQYQQGQRLTTATQLLLETAHVQRVSVLTLLK
ncbi:MAG: single-stranded-DNA-specific exonuclease RecJ [Synechocystis sp.]|nr:single-stranded-DNA-specific exonuclease RecJ [Synechocystis sp.]